MQNADNTYGNEKTAKAVLGGCIKTPGTQEAWSARSAFLTTDRSPDDTAVAIYPDLWFSCAALP